MNDCTEERGRWWGRLAPALPLIKILEDSAQGRWFGIPGLLISNIIDPRVSTVHAQISKQSALVWRLVWAWFGLGSIWFRDVGFVRIRIREA